MENANQVLILSFVVFFVTMLFVLIHMMFLRKMVVHDCEDEARNLDRIIQDQKKNKLKLQKELDHLSSLVNEKKKYLELHSISLLKKIDELKKLKEKELINSSALCDALGIFIKNELKEVDIEPSLIALKALVTDALIEQFQYDNLSGLLLNQQIDTKENKKNRTRQA